MATRIISAVTVLTDYTQAQEDAIVPQLVGTGMGSRIIYNTDLDITRIWNGTAFQSVVAGDVSWGGIAGDILNQVDLQTALSGKANSLGADDNYVTDSEKTKIGTLVSNIGIPVYSRVVSSNATTTGQSLVDVTGLTASLIANGVYEVEAVLSCSTTAVTTGTGYGVQYSAAGATIEGWVSGASTTTADKTLRLNAFNTSSQAFLTSSAQTGGILIKGIVTVGANAGTLSVRHLKVTSGTSTVFIGSYLKITRIS